MRVDWWASTVTSMNSISVWTSGLLLSPPSPRVVDLGTSHFSSAQSAGMPSQHPRSHLPFYIIVVVLPEAPPKSPSDLHHPWSWELQKCFWAFPPQCEGQYAAVEEAGRVRALTALAGVWYGHIVECHLPYAWVYGGAKDVDELSIYGEIMV